MYIAKRFIDKFSPGDVIPKDYWKDHPGHVEKMIVSGHIVGAPVVTKAKKTAKKAAQKVKEVVSE